jgi:hypothetical protein
LILDLGMDGGNGCYFLRAREGDDIRQYANSILAVSIVPRRAGLFRLELRRPWVRGSRYVKCVLIFDFVIIEGMKKG